MIDPGRSAPWLFPAPVRASRFVAGSVEHERFNVAVALGDIAPWSFDRDARRDVLHYDLQTQLSANYPRRLGGGRAGFYQGHYLKGIGRTPAAANWNDPHDRYHGSGHMAASSAANERLISAVTNALAIDRTIVGCHGVLAADLQRSERRLLERGKTSSSPSRFAADARLIAMSVKRGRFARMSNVVFALDHFPMEAREAGRALLAFEGALGVTRPSGDPRALAAAMDAAFHRGLDHFAAFARTGVAWLYTHNNFTLDGRFVDLELPLYIGVPFVGIAARRRAGVWLRFDLSFEVLGFVLAWRGFLHYLARRLETLESPLLTSSPAVRAFMRPLRRAIERRFHERHLVHDDNALVERATGLLAGKLGLDRRDRAIVRSLALLAQGRTDAADAIEKLVPYPHIPTPLPMRLRALPFVPPPSEHAVQFAQARERIALAKDARDFLARVDVESRMLAQRSPASARS